MKKTLIISSAILVALGLTAFGVADYKSSEKCNADKPEDGITLKKKETKDDVETAPDFYFGFGPRFKAVHKEEVYAATNIADFLEEKYMKNIVSIKSVSIIIIEKEAQSHIRADGKSKKFSAKQLKLLRSFDYSSNFTVQIDAIHKSPETGIVEDGHYGPHLTIVPEKQASYNDGNNALIAFLKEKTEENLPILDPKMMRPSKFYFTISKEGKIKNISEHNTTGYPSIDAKILKTIKQLPGTWTPAENALGEKVEQELVFTFGPEGGC